MDNVKDDTRPIRHITTELYQKLGCADAPRGRVSKLLEEIDAEAERLELRVRELELEVRDMEVDLESQSYEYE